jgi:hypothetical protein
VYVSKLILTFSTPHIGHSTHGLFFTRLDCQSYAKLSENDHDLPETLGLAVSIPNHQDDLNGVVVSNADC